MSDELYSILATSCDYTGLPVMNTSQFQAVTEKYGKELFRKTLAEFITTEKPPYPLKEFDYDKVVNTFHKLAKVDYTKFIMNSDKEVMEKYDDYKYPYSKYGLGVIDGPSIYNYTSDYFMNDLRMACGSYGFKAPVTRWNDGDNIWGAFGPIWRGVNGKGVLTAKTYTMAFRLGT